MKKSIGRVFHNNDGEPTPVGRRRNGVMTMRGRWAAAKKKVEKGESDDIGKLGD